MIISRVPLQATVSPGTESQVRKFLFPPPIPAALPHPWSSGPKAGPASIQRMEKGDTHRFLQPYTWRPHPRVPPSPLGHKVAQGEQTQGALPLLRRAVGLPSLAAAQGDGVKAVEGAEGHPRDGDQG